MGKTADKLNYLLGTKEAIRDAIENKGVEVLDSDTFRSYADKIEAIEAGEPINNQEKSISITSNGTRTVTPDEGYTGLSLVQITTNVATEGGDSQEPEYPVIGDGKTYLYVHIDEKHLGQRNYILFSQTVAKGVIYKWDEDAQEYTISGTGQKSAYTTYSSVGDRVISLDPQGDCILGLGWASSNYCLMGTRQLFDGSAYLRAYPSRLTLKAVEIGRNVTSIGIYAFSNCTYLASVVIPESVTSIGNYAFNGCSSLASVVIPEGVTSTGNYAFRYCTSLASVVIPEGVTSIGMYAFRDCTSLASVVIPESVTSIGSSAFYDCSSLASVVIPEGVTSIGSSAFYGCSSLASVVIPEGVTSIGNYTFYNCSSLASVVIPEGVTSIGSSAFSKCDSLTFCDFSRHTFIPTAGSNPFSGTTCKIVVPDILYDEWIVATVWSIYGSRIVKASDYFGLEPTECFELSITADDFDGNKTSTTLYYTAVVNGYYNDGRYVENTPITGTTTIDFPQNTSSSDILREVSFTYLGVTATTTVTQRAYRDYRIVCKYNVTSTTSSTALLYTKFAWLDYMIVEGQQVDVATSYTFSTTGEQEVIFKVNDEADITSVYRMFNAITSLLEVDFCETDLSKATSTSTSSGTAYLFYNCTKLRSVVFPDSLKYMGYYMFYNCKLMASLTIPLVEAPSIYGNYTFGGSSASYSMGYTNRAAGTNILRIPSGATGYNTGAWTARVLSTSYCGFTIEEY